MPITCLAYEYDYCHMFGIFTAYMLDICQPHYIYMPGINARNISGIYMAYNICKAYARYMLDICHVYAWHIHGI